MSAMKEHPATVHGRVAESSKYPLPQVMSPNPSRRRSSRPKQALKILKTSNQKKKSLTKVFRRICTNCIRYRNDPRKKLTKPLSPKKWRNVEELATSSPAANHRCISITTQRKALPTQILKIESYEKCWLHHCMYKKQKQR